MDIRVEFSGAACILLAALSLAIPLDWLMAAFLAAAVHELCHILAVLLVGGKICSIQIGTSGAVIDALPMEPWKELVCILAGPVGSLVILAFGSYIPKTALCGMIQGLFNLIPVYPLDGGRALKCVFRMLFLPEIAEKWCQYTKWVTIFAVVFSAVWSSFRLKLGGMPIFAALIFLSRALHGKISCKESDMGVQYPYHI